MKNRLIISLAVVSICSLAGADYSEKIEASKAKCYEILDQMFFTDKTSVPYDLSIEGMVRASEEIKFGAAETTGWWIVRHGQHIKRVINALEKDEDGAAANEVRKFVERGIEERTKRLFPLIPHNVPQETIEMNYTQVAHIPRVLCHHGLRSNESNCDEIGRKMRKYAEEVIAERRKTEQPRD